MKQRTLSFLLALVMVLGLLPAGAAAADTPVLGFKDTDVENGVLVTDSDFEAELAIQYNFSTRLSFFYGTQTSHQLIADISDVSVADPSLLDVELRKTSDSGEQVYQLTGKALGTTTLTVTAASGTYTMPVEITYPYMGVYTQPVRDLEYLVEDDFAYTDTNKTFYFLTSDSAFQMTECFVSNSDFENNFQITIAPDGSYATVDIVDFTNLDGECPHFRCRGTNSNPDGYTGFGSGYVTFVDGAEAIGYVDIWYDNNQMVYDDTFYKQLDLDAGNSTRIAFGYGNSANYDLLTNVINVTSEDESIATVELRDEDGDIKVWRIQSESLGSTYLNVETADTTYRMPITVEMPRLGSYSQPVRQPEHLITNTFTYSSNNKTFYFILDYKDCTIYDAWVEDSDFSGNFSITATPGSNCVKVEITDTTNLNNAWLNFRCQLADATGNPNDFGTYGTGLRFVNGDPAPGYRRIEWQGDEIYPCDDFESGLTAGIGGSLGLVFYYGTPDNYTALDVTSVSVANPSIASAEYWRDTGDGLATYEVSFNHPGSTELILQTASEEYRISLNVRLYGGYFFTQPAFDTQYIVSSFDVTETDDTFYFVSEPGHTIDSITPHQDFTDVFDISYSADRTYATIKVVKPAKLPTWRMHFSVALRTDSNSFTNGYGFQVNNAVPAPGIKYARWNNGVLETWSDFMSSFSDGFGSNPAVVFYYGSAKNHTALTDIASVTAADPSLVTVEFWDNTVNGEPCYNVTFLKPGTTELIVQTTDGTQYKLPLSINLYDLWAFSKPSFDPDFAIKSFSCTDTQDTFYIVSRSGNTLTSLEIEQDFAGAFTVTKQSDTVYAVQVTDPAKLPGGNYRIDFCADFTDSDGRIGREHVYMPVLNEIPTAGIRYAWYENDVIDARTDFQTNIVQRVGFMPFVPCYGSLSNNSPIENIVSIDSENPALFHVYQQGTAASGGTVWAIDVPDSYASGTANMVVTTSDGTVYKIPVTILTPLASGFESMSSTDPIFDFTFTDDQRTVYVKPLDPTMSLVGIGVDNYYSDAFSVELAPDCSSGTITLKDPSKFSFGKIRVFAEVQTAMGRENAEFYLTLTNAVTPPQLTGSTATPTQYPTWTNENGGSVSHPDEAQQLSIRVPVENQTAEQTTVQGMLAIYNEAGRMLDMRCGTLTLSPNGSDVVELSVDLTGLNGVHHAKLFLLDGAYTPISTVFDLP